MRYMAVVLVTLAYSISAIGVARGDLIDGVYWADEVTEWTGNIQNYGGQPMTDETTWWLTGAPDADVNQNGYAWDPVDNDYVAGWRSCGGSGDESFTVHFEVPIGDVDGPDFMIHYYAGLQSAASVWASSNDVDYFQVGTMGSGTPGYFIDEWIDLDGFVNDARYIRVVRETDGSQTGTFIDALGAPSSALIPTPVNGSDGKLGTSGGRMFPVPEPAGVALIGWGALALARRRR